MVSFLNYQGKYNKTIDIIPNYGRYVKLSIIIEDFIL
jgi:hypothetical protein